VQGIRPAGLEKVPTQELAHFIHTCIESNRHRRPGARQLLKHPYFNTIRAEKCAMKLSSEALMHAGPSCADLQQMMAECAASVAGSMSRTSSEVAEVQQVLQSLDSGRATPTGGVQTELPPIDGLEPAKSAPTLNVTEQLVPPAEVLRGASPARSEPGQQAKLGYRDVHDYGELAATARTSFETASDGSHGSGLVIEPMLTGMAAVSCIRRQCFLIRRDPGD
jgi:serine/threonine protein kinase